MAYVQSGKYRINIDDLLPKSRPLGGVKGDIAIEGAAELEAKLKELPRKVDKKIRRDALKAGSNVVLKRARQLAPKLTGTLRRSIKVKAGKIQKNAIRFYVQTQDGDYRGETFYGAFLEFGHKVGNRKDGVTKTLVGYEPRKGRKRGRKKGIYQVVDRRRSVPPHKYLAPAFVQTKEQALAVIIGTTRDGILQAAKA